MGEVPGCSVQDRQYVQNFNFVVDGSNICPVDGGFPGSLSSQELYDDDASDAQSNGQTPDEDTTQRKELAWPMKDNAGGPSLLGFGTKRKRESV